MDGTPSFCLVFALAGLIDIPAALAQDSKAESHPDWIDEIEIHGFVSTAWLWNFNNPDSGENQLRVFDFRDNAFRIDDVQLTLMKPVEKSGDVGFRFDLDVGSNVPRVAQASGLFDDEDIDLRQAFVSYVAPLGSGLTVDAGKFVTHMGLEVIEGQEDYNSNYSRAFEFGFAIPFTHTGVRASYTLSDKVSLMAMVANGWDTVDDNNDGKAFGGQLAWRPTEHVGILFNYIGSPEQDGLDGNWRHVFDIVFSIVPFPDALPGLGLSGALDHGTESRAAPDGGRARWNAIEGVLRYDFSDRFYLALRGEWFKDNDGTRTGEEQSLKEVTLTPTFLIGEHLAIRPELRIDWSNRDVFEKRDRLAGSQTTAGINVVYGF